jgi:hypothetical protein
MLNLYDNNCKLIYEETRNQTINFYSTDDEETFYKNNKKLGKEWKYHNSTIEYKFNSSGYRTKEITDLNKDFLLTFGCSYTEGVGLHQNELWCEDIAKHINLDLYNHAKQATGIDIQYYNAMLWNMNQMPKPKLVIVQWPYKTRKSFGRRENSHSIYISDLSGTSTADGKWWGKRYIQDTGEMELNVLFWIESFNNVWKLAGVPVLNFTWDHDLSEHLTRSKYQMYYIKNKNRDKARDLSHDGNLFHFETARKLRKLLTQSNFTNKI